MHAGMKGEKKMKERITDIWGFVKDPENMLALGTISALLYSVGYFVRAFKR